MTKVEFCKCKHPDVQELQTGEPVCTACKKDIPPELAEKRTTKEKPGFFRGAKVSRR